MVGWRRVAGLALMLVALLSALAGCGLSGQQPSDLASDQTLKMVLPLDYGGANPVAALDPAQALFPPGLQAANLLFDGLVTLDRNARIEPWGASSWIVSPDGLTYTFTLRPGQHFSDGTLVRPSDYAWSIDRLASPCLSVASIDSSVFTDFSFLAILKDAPAFHGESCASGKPVGARTSLIGDSILPDDSAGTLTLILAHPAGYFLAALATPWSDAIERSVVTGDHLGGDGSWMRNMEQGKTGQGGSGMFYLAAVENDSGSASATSQLTLKPNPHWWGLSAGRRPHFSEVDILVGNLDTFLGDASIGYGDVLSPDLLSRALPQIRQAPYYHETPSFAVASLYFNWAKAPFDDLNARKAFCLAINRAQLDQQARQGIDIPGWHITPQGMDGYDAQLQGPDGAPATGDAALAQRYWQAYLEAHDGHAPRVAMPSSLLFLRTGDTATPLAQMWRRVLGVDVTVYTPDLQITSAMPTYAQIADFVESVDYPDPEDVLSWLSDVQVFGITMPAASPLLRQADALSDMAQRAPLYHQAEQMLIDSVAICPLFQVVDAYALRSWVKGGFAQNGLGVVPNDDWVSGYIARH